MECNGSAVSAVQEALGLLRTEGEVRKVRQSMLSDGSLRARIYVHGDDRAIEIRANGVVTVRMTVHVEPASRLHDLLADLLRECDLAGLQDIRFTGRLGSLFAAYPSVLEPEGDVCFLEQLALVASDRAARFSSREQMALLRVRNDRELRAQFVPLLRQQMTGGS